MSCLTASFAGVRLSAARAARAASRAPVRVSANAATSNGKEYMKTLAGISAPLGDASTGSFWDPLGFTESPTFTVSEAKRFRESEVTHGRVASAWLRAAAFRWRFLARIRTRGGHDSSASHALPRPAQCSPSSAGSWPRSSTRCSAAASAGPRSSTSRRGAARGFSSCQRGAFEPAAVPRPRATADAPSSCRRSRRSPRRRAAWLTEAREARDISDPRKSLRRTPPARPAPARRRRAAHAARPQFWEFVVLVIGIAEGSRIATAYSSKLGTATEQIKEDYKPGELGFGAGVNHASVGGGSLFCRRDVTASHMPRRCVPPSFQTRWACSPPTRRPRWSCRRRS